MKIGVISDTHLGNPGSGLMDGEDLTGTYEELRLAIRAFSGKKPLDFLVLNGDIMDFSASPIEESLIAARPFFRGIYRDKLARQLIYIPGNHDKRIWNAVEWETNVIGKLNRHENPRAARRTQPGIIDTRAGTIKLPGVSRVPGKRRFGGLFLEGLFEEGSILPILVTYPNLYVKTPEDLIMITHGHMMDLAWVLASELLGDVVKEGKLSMVELEEFNAPFNSFMCTGVGYGGDMSELFYRIKKEARQGRSKELKRAMNGLIPVLDRMIPLGLFEFLDNALLQGLKMLAVFIANNRIRDPRYNKGYFADPERKKRFSRFFAAACREAALLGLAPPGKMIYGHTHEIIPAAVPVPFEGLEELKGEDLLMYNTGGWLSDGSGDAGILFIEGTGKLSSEKIVLK